MFTNCKGILQITSQSAFNDNCGLCFLGCRTDSMRGSVITLTTEPADHTPTTCWYACYGQCDAANSLRKEEARDIAWQLHCTMFRSCWKGYKPSHQHDDDDYRTSTAGRTKGHILPAKLGAADVTNSFSSCPQAHLSLFRGHLVVEREKKPYYIEAGAVLATGLIPFGILCHCQWLWAIHLNRMPPNSGLVLAELRFCWLAIGWLGVW